jgi:transcriptional regulator with XRE-family HTH domain
MLPLSIIGESIGKRRRTLQLTQAELAQRAKVGLSTLDALENGRMGELGYTKISNILAAIGLDLKLEEANARRPTLEELLNENRDDQGLDR